MELLASEKAIEHEGPTSEAWLREYAAKLGQEAGPSTFRALRTGLHAIRDRLPPEEATTLADRLPVLIRGVFYTGWRAASSPLETRTADAVYGEIARANDGCVGASPHEVLCAVFSLLEQRVPWDVITRVRRLLPQPLRDIWETA